jgi:hypothetical protein
VKNDTLRAFCCDSLFQNERAEQQKCAEKPIGKVRRTLPIDIHDTSITPIDENDRKQSYNKGAGTDRSGLVRKARSID